MVTDLHAVKIGDAIPSYTTRPITRTDGVSGACADRLGAADRYP